MNQNMPTPNNQGQQPAQNNSGISIVKNNLQALKELKITLTTTSNGAITNAAIFPGPVPTWLTSKFGMTVPDHTNFTFSSSVSAAGATGYGEFKDFAKAGLHIKYIRLQTTVTTAYDGSLFIGEMPANGIANPEEIVLSPYASVIGGNGTYDKTLLINDRPMAVTRNFFMYLSNLPASTTLVIALGIDGIGDTVTVS